MSQNEIVYNPLWGVFGKINSLPSLLGETVKTSMLVLKQTTALTPTDSAYKEVNVAYSQTNVASGGTPPYDYSLSSGQLPAGTSLDSTTGTVAGTPTTSGSFNYTLEVQDADGAIETAAVSSNRACDVLPFQGTSRISPADRLGIIVGFSCDSEGLNIDECPQSKEYSKE